jgi:hypothetical protein
MEQIVNLLSLFLEWFGTLPAPLKLIVIVGFVMPLFAFYSYLNPAPPPPLPPPDGTVILPDGKRGNIYMDGDTYLIKKPRR